MTVYLALLALPLLASFARGGGARERFGWIGVGLALALALGLRREVGVDWDSYVLVAQRAAALPWWDAAALSDAGYMLAAAAVGKAGLSAAALHLLCAAVFAAGLVRFLRAQPEPALGLVIALPVLVLIVGLTVTRQSVALGLLLWALALYASGGRRLPALMIVAAVAFHWTAIVLLPLIPVMAARRVPGAAVVAAGAALGVLLALALQLPPLAERVAELRPSGGAVFRAGPTAIALLAWALLRRRLALDERERRLGAFLAALALFALALLPVLSTAADRLGYYAVPLQIMILTRMPALAPAGAARHAARAAIAAVYVLAMAAWLALTGFGDCLTPYRSYLTDPAAIFDPDAERHRRTTPCLGRSVDWRGEAKDRPDAPLPA